MGSSNSGTQGYTGQTSQIEPDLEFINELIEHITQAPQTTEARLLLMEHYVQCGWGDAAEQLRLEILNFDSFNQQAQRFQGNLHRGGRAAQHATAGIPGKEDSDTARSSPPPWEPSRIAITDPAVSLTDLMDGYASLLADAEALSDDMRLLKDLGAQNCDDQISNLAAISIGQVNSVLRVKPLEGLHAVAQSIRLSTKNDAMTGMDIAIDDLASVVRWTKDSANAADRPKDKPFDSAESSEEDKVRKAVVKRLKGLKALLPADLQDLADQAMMHADHELLFRKYVNDETMVLGDPISTIPRTHFWASEDGYAWDMEELAEALKSASGIMRNPLSRQMFTRADVRAIVRHPLGQGLRALQMEQSSLKQGVRKQTIEQLANLAKVLSEDMSNDGLPSRSAVDEFVSYLETLPEAEQNVINRLKVPGKDSHTGIEFDTTIGEAVTDMQGNRICSHKTGDFLTQAAKYLSRQ